MALFLACAVPVLLCTPDNCHLAWMIAAVACGLAPSSCASCLWVERHSVPVACLPLPWVIPTSGWIDFGVKVLSFLTLVVLVDK